MDTFMVEQLKARWPKDWTLLHVYFVPNGNEIQPLVDVYRRVLADFGFVSRQPDEWLHATVMMVGSIPARDVSPEQRTELTERLRRELVTVPSFTVTCGLASARRSSIALDLVPDHDFVRLADRVQTVAAGIFGDQNVRYSNGKPHITLGYAKGEGNSDMIKAKLRNAGADASATLTVDHVRLVDVLVDHELLQFRWKELAVLPLAQQVYGG